MVDRRPQPPTRISRKFVRYALGFGVGVGIGMVPLQNQLLVLVPVQLQGPLVPIAAFVMGVVAVAVQFFNDEHIARQALKRRFLACLGILAIALVSLLYLYVFRIQSVEVPGRGTTASVIVAPDRLKGCGCAEDLRDIECIREVSLSQRGLDSCWDTKGTRLAFILTYLLLMSTFGALIGLLLVREETRSRKERTNSRE